MEYRIPTNAEEPKEQQIWVLLLLLPSELFCTDADCWWGRGVLLLEPKISSWKMVPSKFLPKCHQQHVVWMIMWSIFWHKESVWNSCLKTWLPVFLFLQLSLQAHVSLFTSGKDSIKRERPLKLEIWVERGHKREREWIFLRSWRCCHRDYGEI